MTDEMLVAQARWLPQYKKEIPAARRRLADAKRDGRYYGTHKGRGAARLHTRTVAEMRRSALRKAAAARNKSE
jgi:alpha-galactosidase